MTCCCQLLTSDWLLTEGGRQHTVNKAVSDSFNFHTVNFSYSSGDIPCSPSYGVKIVQLLTLFGQAFLLFKGPGRGDPPKKKSQEPLKVAQ